MTIEYGKYPLQVRWFRRIDYMNTGHSKLYVCEENDFCAEPYIFSIDRPGCLFSPIIPLEDKVDIVAEIVLSVGHRPSVDISIQQVVEQIEKIKKEDYDFVADAFEIFLRRFSLSDRDCKNRQILRFYRFKDL